jgi:hypothetical protein
LGSGQCAVDIEENQFLHGLWDLGTTTCLPNLASRVSLVTLLIDKKLKLLRLGYSGRQRSAWRGTDSGARHREMPSAVSTHTQKERFLR